MPRSMSLGVLEPPVEPVIAPDTLLRLVETATVRERR